jgi:hypothetical protein
MTSNVMESLRSRRANAIQTTARVEIEDADSDNGSNDLTDNVSQTCPNAHPRTIFLITTLLDQFETQSVDPPDEHIPHEHLSSLDFETLTNKAKASLPAIDHWEFSYYIKR